MKNIRFVAQTAVVAGLYVVLTWLIAPISYGAIQLRISEILVLLVVLNPKYCWALIIGCFVANLASPMGVYDIIFGTFATVVAVFIMSKIKRLWVGGIFPVLSNGFIIALELGIVYDMLNPVGYWYNFLTVAIGEIIAIYIIGLPVMYFIKKNNRICELLDINQGICHED